MSLPACSVIVPTHKRPQSLATALDAIWGQTYRGKVEIIVVFDQCQVDTSVTRDAPNRQVKAVTNKHTPGLPGARNTGIELATAPYVAFCDDDDIWMPSKLARQIDILMEHPRVDVTVSDILILGDGKSRVRRAKSKSLTHARLLRERVVSAHPSTYVVRAKSLSSIGTFDENIPGGFGEDYDWLLRAADLQNIFVIEEPLVAVFRKHTYFRKNWRDIDLALAYLSKKHPGLLSDKQARSRIQSQRAFAQAAMQIRSSATRLSVDAIRSNWKEPRAYISLAVAGGLVKAETVFQTLEAFGRGI